MSEWFKELVLKTSDSARNRGFESHSLRQRKRAPDWESFFRWWSAVGSIGAHTGGRRKKRRPISSKPLCHASSQSRTNKKASCCNAPRCERIGVAVHSLRKKDALWRLFLLAERRGFAQAYPFCCSVNMPSSAIRMPRRKAYSKMAASDRLAYSLQQS